jgi:hypothetical protein
MEDGTPLYDSRVIVEFLDNASPLARPIPADKRERIEVRRWEALADGILDAGVLVRRERLRTSVERSEPWIARIAIATATPAANEGIRPYPHQPCAMAAMPPASPTSDPTDRSIWAVMITINIPTASTPVTEVCRIRLEKFRGSRKMWPVEKWK